MKNLGVMIGIVVGILMGTVIQSMADYSLICIYNRTRQQVLFQHKWEDEKQWVRDGLGKEDILAVFLENKPDRLSPPSLSVHVDADLSSKSVDWQVHSLDSYRSTLQYDCDQAKKYAWIREGTSLKLKTLN